MKFQDSSWNNIVSSSVIVAASVFEISSGKKQTDRGKNRNHASYAIGIGMDYQLCI